MSGDKFNDLIAKADEALKQAQAHAKEVSVETGTPFIANETYVSDSSESKTLRVAEENHAKEED